MPELSKRAESIPESGIRKFVPIAYDRKKEGVHVYHLNIGQPDIPTPKVVRDAYRSFDHEVIAYEDSQGYAKLRENLVGYYKKFGIELTAEDIIITAGGSEAVEMAVVAVADPGDNIIVPEPFYTNYLTFTKKYNVEIVPFTTKIEENFALKNLEEMEKLIKPRTKAILICNPGNPTGVVYTKEEVEKVAEIARKHDIFLIADEVYREFTYDGKTHTSILSLKGLEDNAIVVDSASKRYSACGSRVGWLVTKNKEVMHSAWKCAMGRLSVVTPGQVAIAEAVAHAEADVMRAKQEYDERRKTAYEMLSSTEGITCGYPSGALYMIAKLHGVNAEDFTMFMIKDYKEYSEHVGKEATVLVTPAQGFYATPGLGKDEIRLAFVLNKDATQEAVRILVNGLKKYKEMK